MLTVQWCLTLCDPLDCGPPGSPVHGILQAGTLEWLPCPAPGDLPDHGTESTSLALAGGFFTTSTTWEAPYQAGVTGQNPIIFLSEAAYLSLTEGRSLTLRNAFLLAGPNGKPPLSASFPSCFMEPGLCQLRRGSASPGMWMRSEEGEARRGWPWSSHSQIQQV